MFISSTKLTMNSSSWLQAFLPCRGGWILLWFCFLFLFFAPDHFLADGAVARHVVTGFDILKTQCVSHKNYVWAINPSYPWLTHELFGDLAYGGAYLFGKLKSVALVGILTVAFALMWAYQLSVLRGAGRITGWVLFFPAMIATSVHWLSRSHIFSYLFFLIIYYVAFISQAALRWRVAAAAVTMLLWCNFHGSMFIGLFILCIKPLCALMDDLLAGNWKPSSKNLSEWLVPLACVIAPVLNIRGPGIYLYIVQYLIHPEIALKGGEWHSLDLGFGIGAWSFLLEFALCVLVAIVSPKKPSKADSIVFLSLFAAGLISMRLIPYFALLAPATAGPCLMSIRASFAQHQSDAYGWRQRLAQLDEPREMTRRTLLTQASVNVLILILLVVAFLTGDRFAITDFPPGKLPVAAVNYLADHKISGLGFYFDNWGPYVRYRFPSQAIFIDDKTDFYPRDFIGEYHSALDGDIAVLDKYRIAYVLVPPTCVQLVGKLRASHSWSQPFADQTAVLFVRK